MVINYLYGTEEHDVCLAHILEIFQDKDVLLDRAKALTKVKELNFLGRKLSGKGMDADQRRIKTILEFRPPSSKEEVRAKLLRISHVCWKIYSGFRKYNRAAPIDEERGKVHMVNGLSGAL